MVLILQADVVVRVLFEILLGRLPRDGLEE
jgi:hypothetical protein